MSDDQVREAVVRALTESEEPLRTTKLIELLRELVQDDDPTGDAVKAAIWDLAEARQVDWDPDGRVALIAEAARA